MRHGQTSRRALTLEPARWRCRVPRHPSAQHGDGVDLLSQVSTQQVSDLRKAYEEPWPSNAREAIRSLVWL
jgi:hypothetical protein